MIFNLRSNFKRGRMTKLLRQIHVHLNIFELGIFGVDKYLKDLSKMLASHTTLYRMTMGTFPSDFLQILSVLRE
jgi:hypothetical protein